MDVSKIEELGLEPIKNILNELGGWPVLLGPEKLDKRELHCRYNNGFHQVLINYSTHCTRPHSNT